MPQQKGTVFLTDLKDDVPVLRLDGAIVPLITSETITHHSLIVVFYARCV